VQVTVWITCCRMFSVIITVDPCENFECPTGSRCKVFRPTGKAFCQPSCGIDNGGCAANETCSLRKVRCARAPCPPVVRCLPSE